MRTPRPLAVTSILFFALTIGSAFGGDVRIKLPKRTKPTPVQSLNREGVKAIEKHDYRKARKLFYEAYLLDPNDPFTLNNLGYISELEGDLERAQRFYSLAVENTSDALVDRASSPVAEGQPVSKIAGSAEDARMQINRINVAAMSLLLKDRAPEADLLLQKGLALDPDNPFTLNNMGYAKEKEGELEAALSYYAKAANRHSQEPIVVTVNNGWRGRGISQVALENADKVRKDLRKSEDRQTRVARLNLRGVSALNRNERRSARQYFEQAYKLDPGDAFTLNNMGYLAEMDGDRETADFYYAKAQEAEHANAKVSVATRRDAEGMKVGDVANSSDAKVQARIEAQREARQRQGGPVVLKRRDNTPVVEPSTPPPTPPK